MRPHVLWFDEYYTEHARYQFPAVLAAAGQATFVLFVGTSFSVGLTEALLRATRERDVPAWSIDPSAARAPDGVEVVVEPAEVALPALVQLLTAGAS